MENEIKKTENSSLEIGPKELKEYVVEPAIKVGKRAGNFLSDTIDVVVDAILGDKES